jgi:hypothetical protein
MASLTRQRGANMKRESLHGLMRRYHVTADDFRER